MDFTHKLVIGTAIVILVYLLIAFIVVSMMVPDKESTDEARHRHPENLRRHRSDVIDTSEIRRRR